MFLFWGVVLVHRYMFSSSMLIFTVWYVWIVLRGWFTVLRNLVVYGACGLWTYHIHTYLRRMR
jgi:hypothetical protein